MKRIVSLFLALVMALSMSACAKEESQPTAAATEAPAVETAEEAE